MGWLRKQSGNALRIDKSSIEDRINHLQDKLVAFAIQVEDRKQGKPIKPETPPVKASNNEGMLPPERESTPISSTR